MKGKPPGGAELEIEVKVPIDEISAVVSRLEAIGATRIRERHLEENFLFDYPERLLTRGGCMLRVRRTPGRGFLTFKGKGRIEAGAKVRPETEVVVEDADICMKIIESIGLKSIYRYEKYRTEYRHADCEIAIDELPFGKYMELEGSHQGIQKVASELGVSPERFLAKSYRTLHAEHQARIGAPMGDLLFKEWDQDKGCGKPKK